MTREQQIEFMTNCQDRIRGYVANWMDKPFFKDVFRRRLGHVGNTAGRYPAPSKTSGSNIAARWPRRQG